MSKANFIQATEIWVPNSTRTKLTLRHGHYGELDQFERISRGMQFAYDEGLPGKCWSSGKPIVLTSLSNSYFKRGDAAMTHGIDCAVAIPFFAGADLNAIVVFLCGHDGHRIGALELWHAAPGEPQMGLDEGYFGVAEKFEFTSRHTKFSRKVGLPGMVWAGGMPVIMEDLGRGGQFVRSGSAEKVGINRGVGMSCQVRPGLGDWVLTFLSARNSPIAKRFEVWLPDDALGLFRYSDGYCENGTDLAALYAGAAIPLDVGPLGETRISGIPVIAPASNSPGMADDAMPQGATMLVLPVTSGQAFAANLVVYI